MASPTVYFDGKKCGREWSVILSAARRAGIGFTLNQGRRSIADQWYFWNIYKRYGHPLAAYPSQGAPHIRYGEANHACDIPAPQVYALAAWLRRHGVFPRWTVRGEPWHIELTLGEVQGLAKRLGGAGTNPYPTLRRGARGQAVKRLQRMLHNKHVAGAPRVDGSFGPTTDKCVKHFQTKHKLKADGVVGPATWRLLRR